MNKTEMTFEDKLKAAHAHANVPISSEEWNCAEPRLRPLVADAAKRIGCPYKELWLRFREMPTLGEAATFLASLYKVGYDA